MAAPTTTQGAAVIPAVKITIGFSESPHVREGKTFTGENIWQEAAAYLNQCLRRSLAGAVSAGK